MPRPQRIEIATQQRAQWVEITDQVRTTVERLGVADGIALVFCPHTTAGLTINENADPDVARDMIGFLDELVPRQRPAWRHAEGNSDAHVKASLMGSSVRVIVSEGRLQLGTWQGIYFCEFDGPRRREAWVSVEQAG